MVDRKGWRVRLIKFFFPWTNICPWEIAMMNTQKEIQYIRKGANKKSITNQIYDRIEGGGPEDSENGSYQRDFTVGNISPYLTKYTQELDEIVPRENLFAFCLLSSKK